MNKLFLTSIILASLSSPAHAEFQKVWQNCEKNEDCVVTRDVCDNAIGVNRLFLNAAEEHRKVTAPRVNCSTMGPKDISFYQAMCEHQKIPCAKKNWLGMDAGIDHESTCVSSEKKCLVTQ